MSLEEQHDSESEFKRKRSESPVSTTCEHADLSEGPSDEYRNKRVKTERPASPAPSFLSLKSDLSMAPPDNFKRVVFPLDFRERPASPTPSYTSLRTDMSIDAPNNFKREQTFHMVTRVGSERAPSPTLSSVSELTECFVEQPTNFKAEETYHLGPRLLTENCLKCPVCKSILKDPVSIPCGHNFCRDCINSSWDSAEDYVCPQCERGYKICPELNTNTALAEVVKHLQQAGFSPALPPCSYAGPEDVACDLCSDRRLKAVKTCLTCGVFLCETHIRSHYTIPALQKHTLSDVTGVMEKKLSTQNLPTDNFSSIVGEQEKDWSMSGLNTSMANEDAGSSTPETDVKKDITNATHLELMCSKLQQEVLGLKESFSKLKKHNTKTDKYVWEGSDDEESYNDSDEEENENSYDEEDRFNYDMDNYSEMDKSDESKSENDNDEDEDNEYDEDEDNEYDEEEDNYEYDEDEDNDNSDEEDEYDVDEYGY